MAQLSHTGIYVANPEYEWKDWYDDSLQTVQEKLPDSRKVVLVTHENQLENIKECQCCTVSLKILI